MTISASAEAPPVIQNRRAKRIFSISMVIGTITPIIVFMFMYAPYGYKDNTRIENEIIWLIMFFAQGHVGLTFLMYLDKGFHPVIRKNRTRFVIMPILLVGIVPFILMSNDMIFYSSAFLVIAWNIWHFSKQNIGVVSLVSIAEGQPVPNNIEKHLVSIACGLAIAAHYPIQFPSYLGSTWIHPILVQIGNYVIYPYVIVVSAAIILMIKNRRNYNFLKAAFYLLALTVFGMVFVARHFYPGNPTVISMGYSTAHAIQYIIIMYLVTLAAGASGSLVVKNEIEAHHTAQISQGKMIAGVIASITLLLWGTYVMKGQALFADLNAYFGTTMLTKWLGAFGICLLFTHFIIDAGAFKLSQQAQRNWLKGRLGFLMQR